MQRSIEGVFVEYPVCVISLAGVLVAVVERRLFLLVFVVIYNRRSTFFFSVNCNREFWSLSSD